MDSLFTHSIIKRDFFICIVLILFATTKAYSQRNSSSIIHQNTEIKVVDIFLESTIELEIRTTKNSQIKIVESQGGEYKSAILLSSKIIKDTLKITDPFNPSFNFPQDKLSAHKIIDGKAIVYLPEGLTLQINTRSCFLKISGVFKDAFINIESGSCLINKMIGNYHIISVHAGVQVIEPTSFINASSRYGRIINNSTNHTMNYNLEIETITAPITIKD